ncbi:MAG TPA: hypothetical protein PLO16_14910 [Acidocella sp.]|nr:hypothetical protein [Acidocella sp.]
MFFEPKKLDEMAASKKPADPNKPPSIRARIAENLEKIEAAQANGYHLSEIAAALGIESKNPQLTLSAYLGSIRRSLAKRAAKAARGLPPVPVTAKSERPAPPSGALPPLPATGPTHNTADAWSKLKPLKGRSEDTK